MDSAPPNQSILDTLRTVEFRLGLKGYNVDEVDEYLEKAAVEAESVREQLRLAAERLQHANERIGQLELEVQRAPGDRPVSEPTGREPAVTDDTLQRTLLLAQRFVDQTKRESEAEATEVVSRAEERARAVVAQAEDRARQMSSEAEQRLRDEVGRLEDMRTRLAGDVEMMARHLDEQRTKIRASLTEVLKWVDERMPSAGSLTAVRGRPADKTDDAGPRSLEGTRPATGPERPPGQPDRRPPTAAPEAGGPPTAERPQAPVGARLRSVDAPPQLDDLLDNGQRSE